MGKFEKKKVSFYESGNPIENFQNRGPAIEIMGEPNPDIFQKPSSSNPFSNTLITDYDYNNIDFKKSNKDSFQSDLLKCSGVITASGFSTTSEALILNKKLWSIPIKGQYEQLCNAISLRKMGILTENFRKDFIYDWIKHYKKINYKWEDPTKDIIRKIIKIHEKS